MLKIATRGSKLALWQANHIKELLEKKHGLDVELVVIKTSGDKILDVPLAKIGGKGLFVKELETALLDGRADLAVHSMKDVPVELPAGLEICVYPCASSPNDALLSVKYNSVEGLKTGAVVGTSSLRRKLQIEALRPDINVKDLRGNVDTRINKLASGEYDAIILAEAGLLRMGLTHHIKESIPVEQMIPAVCQGILGIEVRSHDSRTKELLNFLNDPLTEIRVKAERAFLKTMMGGCQVPIGCHAVIEGKQIKLCGYLSDLKGEKTFKQTISGETNKACVLGKELARRILEAGGEPVIKEIYNYK